MSYVFIKKRRRFLGIDSLAISSKWILLQKTGNNVQVVRYGNNDELQQIKHCHEIYTAVAERHIVKKSLPILQPLNDQQIMLQLQLSANNLFNEPLATLAIDFYYSSAQQLTIFATPQSIINQIVQYLNHYHLHATAVEPTSQALRRIIDFHTPIIDADLFIHLNNDGFYLLSCSNKIDEYCHYHPWLSPPTDQAAIRQLVTTLQNPQYCIFERAIISNNIAVVQFSEKLRQLLNIPISKFNPLEKIGGNCPDNPDTFTLAIGLALRGIVPHD